MSNPWKNIPLSDYENHMSLDSVKQLQTMNEIMKSQFGDYDVRSASVFGVAGGNGLEHVDAAGFDRVYGIDINGEYLSMTKDRYKNLGDVLECLEINLIDEWKKLPGAELVIANLLVEYIGYDVFGNAVKKTSPKYVSCVIQINTDKVDRVSDSPYLHAFDRLDEVHHQIEESRLTETMEEIGYYPIKKESHLLPDGKSLLRLDYAAK